MRRSGNKFHRSNSNKQKSGSLLSGQRGPTDGWSQKTEQQVFLTDEMITMIEEAHNYVLFEKCSEISGLSCMTALSEQKSTIV